jgi:hypothetical protein
MDVGILSSQQKGHSNDGFLGEITGDEAADTTDVLLLATRPPGRCPFLDPADPAVREVVVDRESVSKAKPEWALSAMELASEKPI